MLMRPQARPRPARLRGLGRWRAGLRLPPVGSQRPDREGSPPQNLWSVVFVLSPTWPGANLKCSECRGRTWGLQTTRDLSLTPAREGACDPPPGSPGMQGCRCQKSHAKRGVEDPAPPGALSPRWEMHLQLGKMPALMAQPAQCRGACLEEAAFWQEEAPMGVCREHADKAPKAGAGTQVAVAGTGLGDRPLGSHHWLGDP